LNGSNYCTDLSGITINASAADYPNASAVQLATMRLLQVSAIMMNTPGAINTGIKASDLLDSSGIIHSLPDDQWIQELIGWESHVWAGLQHSVADHAIGTTARGGGAASLQSNETDIGEQQLCGSQRMRMAGGFAQVSQPCALSSFQLQRSNALRIGTSTCSRSLLSSLRHAPSLY
jgi:hypothetical protein